MSQGGGERAGGQIGGITRTIRFSPCYLQKDQGDISPVSLLGRLIDRLLTICCELQLASLPLFICVGPYNKELALSRQRLYWLSVSTKTLNIEFIYWQIESYFMSGQAEKLSHKKIKYYSFQVEVVKVHLRTLQEAGVLVSFRIGRNEVKTKEQIQIINSDAEPETPQSLELHSEMIFDERKKVFQPLKAILKVFLVYEQFTENQELKRTEEMVGIVYLNLADQRNKLTSLGNRVMPLQNCVDTNAKLEFRIFAAQFNTRDEEVLSDPGGVLAESVTLSSNSGEEHEDSSWLLNPKLQQLSKQIKDIQRKYEDQVKLNQRYIEEEWELGKELARYRERSANLEKNLEECQKQLKNLKIQKRALDSDQRLKDINKVKMEYESMKKGLLQQNINLKRTIKEYQRQRMNFEQIIQKLKSMKENSHKLELNRLSMKIKELTGYQGQKIEQALTSDKQKRELENKLLESEQQKRRIRQFLNLKPEQKNVFFKRIEVNTPKKCNKCVQLAEQYRTKEILYENQLFTLQSIVNEAKCQNEKLNEKFLKKAKKYRELKKMISSITNYKESFNVTLQQLGKLIPELNRRITQNLNDPKYLQPEGFDMAIKEIINELRLFMISKPKIQAELNGNLPNKIPAQVQFLLKQKQTTNRRLQKQLQKTKADYEYIKLEFQKFTQTHIKVTQPQYIEASFSKPQPEEKSQANSAHQQNNKTEEEMRMYRTVPLGADRKNSKTLQQSELFRLDQEFTIQNQKEVEVLKKMITLKEKLCGDLDKSNKQLNEDYKLLKNQCEAYRDTISKLRSEIEVLRQYAPIKRTKSTSMSINGLATIAQTSKDALQQEIKEQLKDMIQSIETSTDKQPQKQPQPSYPQRLSKQNLDKKHMLELVEIKEELSRRLRGVSLELLKAHMMRITRCNPEESQNSTVQYQNIHNRLEFVGKYLEGIGK